MWKYPYKTKPYEHQRKALQLSADKNVFAYFMEMGTGKTKTTIDSLGYLWFKRNINAALIIAPKSVYTVWDKEIDTHLPDEIPRIKYLWKINKEKEWNKFNSSKDLKLFLINVEALSTKKGVDWCKKFLTLNPMNMIIIDESTTIKNPQAKRTKIF
jgi:SNF2 family DNA or RNA helicase